MTSPYHLGKKQAKGMQQIPGYSVGVNSDYVQSDLGFLDADCNSEADSW